jgi:hypothetical protein
MNISITTLPHPIDGQEMSQVSNIKQVTYQVLSTSYPLASYSEATYTGSQQHSESQPQ